MATDRAPPRFMRAGPPHAAWRNRRRATGEPLQQALEKPELLRQVRRARSRGKKERREALEQLVGGHQLIFPRATTPCRWPSGVGRGAARQLRGHGRQGPGVSLHGWTNPLVAQGKAEGLSSEGSRLPPGMNYPKCAVTVSTSSR